MRQTLDWCQFHLRRNTWGDERGDYKEFCEEMNYILGGQVSIILELQQNFISSTFD